ncbi:MAG: cupin domain-containing protein [Chitinispirillaceae bacterium]|nr:cupin domain-containing protein [Chitinispirillaceae bacterium]
MSTISITRQPAMTEIQQRGIFNWPIWEKEVSRFDWFYDEPEECYFLEGKVVVESKDGSKVEFGKGDLVKFPKGLGCTWDIREPVRKHYNFG